MRELRLARYQAGIYTLLIMLVLITPLCGLLFNCGCTWPWQGLESHCNIHQPETVHQCPWCVSVLMGAISCGLAFWAGFVLAMKPIKSGYDVRDSAMAGVQKISIATELSKRVVVGILGFLVVAVITGWLSGYVQEYPYFFLLSGGAV